MTLPQKHLFTIFLCFTVATIHGQKKSNNLAPITLEFIILDTIETKQHSSMASVVWLNDTLNVNFQNKKLEFDSTYLSKIRKALKDSSLYKKKEDLERLTQLTKTGGQNCFSYALEKYFDSSNTFNQSLFGERTRISMKEADIILKNYFKKIDEFPTRPKRNLKRAISNDVILAFSNKSDWTIHFVYFTDGTFYTKNGSWEPSEFQSLKKFLKVHYWDTKNIGLYQIDSKKVNGSVRVN